MKILDLARRTKIVATIGPATESASQISKLVEAGATTFRLNFSHGDHEEHAQRIKTIRKVSEIEERFTLGWIEEPARRWDFFGSKKSI